MFENIPISTTPCEHEKPFPKYKFTDTWCTRYKYNIIIVVVDNTLWRRGSWLRYNHCNNKV